MRRLPQDRPVSIHKIAVTNTPWNSFTEWSQFGPLSVKHGDSATAANTYSMHAKRLESNIWGLGAVSGNSVNRFGIKRSEVQILSPRQHNPLRSFRFQGVSFRLTPSRGPKLVPGLTPGGHDPQSGFVADRDVRIQTGIVRRPNGTYRIRWYAVDGSRQSLTYDRLTEARQGLAEKKAEAAEAKKRLKGILPQLETADLHHSFGDLSKRYLAERVPMLSSPESVRSHIRIHLDPYFKDLELRQITTERVGQFVLTYEEPRTTQLGKPKKKLSRNTVNHLTTQLGIMLRFAVSIGWMDEYELPKITKFKLPKKRTFKYLKTSAEIATFLKAAQKAYQKLFVLYATAVYTGMRSGELAGLRWSDVMLERDLIIIRRSYDKETTKGKEERAVPIPPSLRSVLLEWKAQSEGSLLFPNEAGEMMDKDSRPFKSMLTDVLKEAKLGAGYITMKSLRHTFASHFVMNGGPMSVLQRLLGHKDPSTTMIYAHLAPDALAEYASVIPDCMPGPDAKVLRIDSK